MTLHGVIMAISGLAFGVAIVRAAVLPTWTGVALIVTVEWRAQRRRPALER